MNEKAGWNKMRRRGVKGERNTPFQEGERERREERKAILEER